MKIQFFKIILLLSVITFAYIHSKEVSLEQVPQELLKTELPKRTITFKKRLLNKFLQVTLPIGTSLVVSYFVDCIFIKQKYSLSETKELLLRLKAHRQAMLEERAPDFYDHKVDEEIKKLCDEHRNVCTFIFTTLLTVTRFLAKLLFAREEKKNFEILEIGP